MALHSWFHPLFQLESLLDLFWPFFLIVSLFVVQCRPSACYDSLVLHLQLSVRTLCGILTEYLDCVECHCVCNNHHSMCTQHLPLQSQDGFYPSGYVWDIWSRSSCWWIRNSFECIRPDIYLAHLLMTICNEY